MLTGTPRVAISIIVLGCAACVGDSGVGSADSGTGAADADVTLNAQVPPGLIAHALGGIDGAAYTNAEEAFLLSYGLGFSWFEVDLLTTSDDHLVCVHDDKEAEIGLEGKALGELTLQEFLTYRYLDSYTLISFEQLLELMLFHEDVMLVTDTKGWSAEKMELFTNHVDKVDPALMQRMILQIYRAEDWPLVEGVEARYGELPWVIFTLYATDMANADVVKLVTDTGIPIVTMPNQPSRVEAGFIEQLHALDVFIYVHTINSASTVDALRGQGIDGFYTDFLVPTP